MDIGYTDKKQGDTVVFNFPGKTEDHVTICIDNGAHQIASIELNIAHPIGKAVKDYVLGG